MNPRIASVETFVASYPVVGKFKFFKQPTRDTVVVKITDDAGRVGWGQSVPSPTWSYETIETVRTTLDSHLAPALVGLDPFDIDEVWRVMNRVIAPSFSTGQPICKAGIDLALFDLTRGNLGPRAGAVTLSWTIDARTRDDVSESIADAHARGYRNFNVKVGSDAAFDVEMCREIRRLAPDAFVWVDANGGYDPDTALAVAPQFADLGIAALEQPLPANHLGGFRKLREQRALPILMDEPIVSLADLRAFHELDLLDGVAMKVSRCGGLSESRRVVEYMRQHGLLFFASGLTDPDLSLAASLLLFSSCGLERPAALNAPQFLSGSILKSPIVIDGDQAAVPTGSGLGVEVDEHSLRA
ncbi:MAG: enolase C-terminal domain-like protein [Chthoniobacteraceae bacterium]